MRKLKKYSSAQEPSKVNDTAVAYHLSNYSNQNPHTLLRVIRDGISYDEFEKIKERSGLTLAEWANYLNLSERTLTRYAKNAENLDKSTSERVIEIAMLQERASAVFGDLNVFNQWLSSPVRALGNEMPKEWEESSTVYHHDVL
jgi:putative toxin-antitoxin system antitoxin component (TIGR02293 family)